MNTVKTSGSAAEWECARKKYPELHLTSLGRNPDDLCWLIVGQPDPSISRHYWEVVYSSFSDGQLLGAAQQLLNFFRHHSTTFLNSGWVATALGRIILEDENAASKFLGPYTSSDARTDKYYDSF